MWSKILNFKLKYPLIDYMDLVLESIVKVIQDGEAYDSKAASQLSSCLILMMTTLEVK